LLTIKPNSPTVGSIEEKVVRLWLVQQSVRSRHVAESVRPFINFISGVCALRECQTFRPATANEPAGISFCFTGFMVCSQLVCRSETYHLSLTL